MGMLLLSFLKEWLFHNNILNNTLDFVCSVFGPISCWFSVSGQFPGDSIFFSLSTFQILFLWPWGEMEEKNGTYYKSNHGLLLQLRSLVWDKNVIAPKSGKIYVLLRLLVKHWIQDPDIFHCLINYMIYHMSFPSAQFLFIDSNVRDVTWHKSYPEMATIQFYSDGYVSSVLNCEAILLLITCSFFSLAKSTNKVSESIPSTVNANGMIVYLTNSILQVSIKVSICFQCTMLQLSLCSLCGTRVT